jgi:multiple sugar transport system substrate-binding protein
MDMNFRKLGMLLACATVLSTSTVLAQDALVVMGHKVHQDSITVGPGGDVSADWRKKTGRSIEWITLGTIPLRERLFREANLSRTTVDIGFLLNTQLTPQITTMFEPLNDYLSKAGIEDFDDIAKSTLDAVTFNGKIYAIPFRQATQGLHINMKLLKERGLTETPKTIEQVLDYARKLSYTRSDGTRVHGLILGAYTHQLALLRALGGEFITPDLKMTRDVEGLKRYFTLIHELFETGVLPKATTTFDQNTPLEWMLQGRAAMTIYPTARNVQMNDQKLSRYPGDIQTFAVPPSVNSKQKTAPGLFEFWAMAIPRHSADKDAAWDFIRHVSTREATVREALNGNGPIRASAYDDPRIRKEFSYADEERKAFLSGEAAIPAFDNATRVADIWKEAFEAAMLGLMSPEEATQDLVARVTPLLPK